jgi:hypothetical protein
MADLLVGDLGGQLLAGEFLEQGAELVGDLLVLGAVFGRVDVVAGGLAEFLLGGVDGCFWKKRSVSVSLFFFLSFFLI